MNNCTNPPHFPPHCGCPAGYHGGGEEINIPTQRQPTEGS
jgi:hypothetical protein